MTNKKTILDSLGVRVDSEFSCYYSNGSFVEDIKILEISDYFVFVSGDKNKSRRRESHTSVIKLINNGLWRKKYY